MDLRFDPAEVFDSAAPESATAMADPSAVSIASMVMHITITAGIHRLTDGLTDETWAQAAERHSFY